MNTQISFKIDKKLKDSAMKKADKEGVSLSSFLKLSLKAFVEDDLEIGVIQKQKILNAGILRELDCIDSDIESGKNLSPVFGDAKSAISHLKKKCK